MFPELTIEGAPYERGRQYGAAMAPLIRHSIASYARLFAHRRGLDWQASQALAMDYVPLLVEVAPDLLEEMRGIADGAGLGLAEIVALNVRTELMAGIGVGVRHPDGPAALARNHAAGVPEHPDEPSPPAAAPAADDGECTTAAVTPAASATGAALLAQTWDWQSDQRGACIMLRVRAPGVPQILTMTEAGILAKIGMNSAGVAVGLNLLRSQSDGREVGMPVHVLLRMMLQARDFAEARAMADLAPAGGSSCVTLAAGAELASLELSPHGVGEVRPTGGLLAHANHCVDAAIAADECALEPSSTSRERYSRARELLEQTGAGSVSVATLQAILRDHGGEPRCICRHPDTRLSRVDRGESICGVVIDLGAQVIPVAPDVPCTVPFTAVALS